MKQLFQNMKNGETRIKDLPIPKPGKGCALVQTAYSLVSAGTEKSLVEFSEKNLAAKAVSRPDLVRQVLNKAKREGVLNSVQAAFNRLDQPMFPGYSSAGTITALGEGMQGFKVGDRVACGGGNHAVHAEYEVVPRNLLVKLPDSVSFEEAAFSTLGSVAIHGLRLAAPQLNDTVLVIGLGLLGLMEVQIAKAAGCRVMGMDISKSKIKKTIYDVIIGHSDMEEAIIKSNFKNLWVVPATIDLAGAELELYELSEDDNFAKLAVDSVKERFDYIFIDCPPSLGMLTVKALSVSDGIVIPMQCEFYSLEGMSQLLNTVKTIRRLYNPELRVVGILLTMYNGRLTLTGQVVAELKKYYAEQLFKVPSSRSVRLSEAPGYGEPICYHDPYGKGSLEYAAVAKELMMRI